MRVELVQATPNPGRMIADISSICYGKDAAKNPEKLLKHLNDLGHHSTFEHVYYTFKIEGISRSCLAQLTRHRHASFTVRSQRYCNEEETEFIIPPAVDEMFDVSEFKEATKRVYKQLIDAGIKKEDARFILPEATATELYMSMNLRELIHVYKLRTDKAAQWEIQNLVNEMSSLVIENSPELTFMFE